MTRGFPVAQQRALQVSGRSLAHSIIPESVDNHWPIDGGSGSILTDVDGDRDFSLSGATWDGDNLLFDGSDDYAYNSNSDGYFSGLDDFSVFGWFNPSGFGTNRAFMSVYNPYDDERSWVTNLDSNDTLGLATSTNGTDPNNTKQPISVLSTGTWYSFAVTRKASDGNVDFYLDGSYQGSDSTYSGTLHNTTTDARFGALVDANNWDGYLKSFVFARDHLFSESEIQALHDATGPK